MLTHPTLDKLQALRFTGMLRALEEQMQMPDIDQLDFEQRLGLLVDREMTERENRRLKNRLSQAKLRHPACVEDIDYRAPRGLDKALLAQLASCRWIHEGLNLIVIGPTGVGKTWIACALAHKGAREGYRVQYLRMSRLLDRTQEEEYGMQRLYRVRRRNVPRSGGAQVRTMHRLHMS